MQQLRGQVALVTGAGRGIGREIALGLARKGMRIGLVGRTSPALESALSACAAAGAKAVAVLADVTIPHQVHGAVATVERDLGPVDLLVNNAGRIERTERPVWEADPREWWAVVEANLRGSFLVSHAVLRSMVARGRGGRVVDLSTGFAVRDAPIYSGYAASKTALLRLAGAIAAAGEPHDVRCFEVSPGLVRTRMSAAMPMHADVPEEAWTPPERVVELVVAIAEGQLDHMSGRYMRAGTDDVATLRARADQIRDTDARTLRLRPYGPDDPLA